MNGFSKKKVDLAFELGFQNGEKSVVYSGKTFENQLIIWNKSGKNTVKEFFTMRTDHTPTEFTIFIYIIYNIILLFITHKRKKKIKKRKKKKFGQSFMGYGQTIFKIDKNWLEDLLVHNI